MGTSPDFLAHLAEVIDGDGLLPAQGRIVVGVSGGADSVALLHGLWKLNRWRDFPWQMHVGHLHHGIRGAAADEDAQFVRSLAHQLDLPVTVEQVDVPALAKAGRQSMEEAARRARYDFLKRVCLLTGSRCIALAHHADDNAETILHRILRGTGLRGLAGIAPRRPLAPDSDIAVVRPLLKLHRQDILTFLRAEQLPWREDHTNAQTSLTRNLIRHDVLPMLETRINPRARGSLIRLAEQARLAESYLAETARRTLEALTIRCTDRELILNLPGLLRRSDAIRAELVLQVFRRLRVGEQRIDRRHVAAVLRLAEQGASNKRIHLPGRLMAARRYDRLIFSLPAEGPPAEEFIEATLEVPGQTILRRRGICLRTQLLAFESSLPQRVARKDDPWSEYMDAEKVGRPLVVRPRRVGERFWPLGGPGRKKLSDFFNERKIDVRDRDRIAVVCDPLGPIWVMGMRIDERVKLHRHTRQVLLMTVRSLDDGGPRQGAMTT